MSEIRKFHIDAEIAPGFSFRNHTGFLPFKVVVYDCPNRDLNQTEWLTGFELSVSRMEGKKGTFFSKIFGKKKAPNCIEDKLSEADTEVRFRISSQDSFEFRIGWYAAAALAFVSDGVLTDLHEGMQMDGTEMIRHAHTVVLNDEKLLGEQDWRVHPFKDHFRI
ncbi:hypothetical protein [Paenibacillus konkukensis]|uniref:hypothetical protein n=1 Tax=Paenibacillus konkukensis TaxID=2020716 RepID=UPI00201E6CA5|nr:hypothetical protein [Paenibacillus konkukensis]